MTVYAIGDIQGCFSSLQRLLEKIEFDIASDILWFAGDLINRGPHSLETLRFIMSLGSSAISILGNHDLHFLAVHSGKRTPRPSDTFDSLLAANDVEELAHWLRHQPLVHCDPSLKIIMTHAGVYPGWTRKQLCEYATQIEEQLQSDDYTAFIESVYGINPNIWDDHLSTEDRNRFIVNALTRMRFCHLSGALDFSMKEPPKKKHDGWLPWYLHPDLKCDQWRIVFGHWSALGYQQHQNIISLDSGCVWGGQLTAVKLDGNYHAPYWQVECSDLDYI